jgi:hypothetical protein
VVMLERGVDPIQRHVVWARVWMDTKRAGWVWERRGLGWERIRALFGDLVCQLFIYK